MELLLDLCVFLVRPTRQKISNRLLVLGQLAEDGEKRENVLDAGRVEVSLVDGLRNHCVMKKR